MFRTISHPKQIVHEIRQGCSVHPLAGTVSKDGYIFRHCLVSPDGEPYGIINTEAFEALQESGVFKKRPRAYMSAPRVDLSLLPQRTGGADEVEDCDETDSYAEALNS